MSKVFIDGFEIDAVLREEHTYESDVTEHPVEEGADIVDHIRTKPIRVSLDGVVSNTPLKDLADRRGGGNPANDALAKLRKIMEDRKPISIVTNARKYDNMVIQSFMDTRDSSTGEAFKFTASFVEIKLVTNARTTITVKIPRAKNKDNKGHKAAATTPLAKLDKCSETTALQAKR